MSLAGWIYDHAPEPVKQWMDARSIQRAADQEYDAYLTRKASGNGTALDRWNFDGGSPKAVLPAATQEPRPAVAANDGIHLLRQPIDVKTSVAQAMGQQATQQDFWGKLARDDAAVRQASGQHTEEGPRMRLR
jgi:hypothetical protein